MPRILRSWGRYGTGLAYFEFVRINGSTDPMSVLRLPPRLEITIGSRRAPIRSKIFQRGDFVRVIQTRDDQRVKELYSEYRIHYEMGERPAEGSATELHSTNGAYLCLVTGRTLILFTVWGFPETAMSHNECFRFLSPG